MKKADRAAQARRELDRKLQALEIDAIRVRPRAGWIRAIRDALGMSQAALATRMRTSAPNVSHMEQSEVQDSISLGTLRRAAEALKCSLVYALVPKTTLERTVRLQARGVAIRAVGYVTATMDLEDQAIDPERSDQQLQAQIDWVIDKNLQWR